MSNELTQDRIKEAIDWVAEEKIVTDMQRHLKATRVQEVDKIATTDVLKTILAALDAVRWRDVSEHPKDGEDVLAMMKADWICVVTFRASDNAYLGAFDCNETDDIKGWIPYPVWEE